MLTNGVRRNTRENGRSVLNESTSADELGPRSHRPIWIALAAAAFLSCSGFLFYTLILDEPYMKTELEEVVVIAVPGVIGLVLAVVAGMSTRRR